MKQELVRRYREVVVVDFVSSLAQEEDAPASHCVTATVSDKHFHDLLALHRPCDCSPML